ncbi:MAG: hypothetical protein C5B59_14840 [Bacteroidetes bacterium]|nr:MAG: hypothetical protein C5B59_14840 [Bacteroidota bacterium]
MAAIPAAHARRKTLTRTALPVSVMLTEDCALLSISPAIFSPGFSPRTLSFNDLIHWNRWEKYFRIMFRLFVPDFSFMESNMSRLDFYPLNPSP